jgi:branched-chain amino acid transport system permease protein
MENEFIHLLKLLIYGIGTGSIYSLSAVGLVIIFKPTGVTNFAQGDFSMLGAYFVLQLHVFMGLPYVISFILLLPFSVFIGVIVGTLVNIPLKQNRITHVILATLGMGIVLQNLVFLKYGANTFYFPSVFPKEPIKLWGISIITYDYLFILAITLAVIITIGFFFQYSNFGIAMRATAQNRVAALLSGISTKTVIGTSWGLATMVAMIAGVLYVPLIGITPYMGLGIVLKAFTAAVIGGLTSLGGAVIAGLILGIIDNLVGGYLSPVFENSVTFIVLLLIMTFRPSGLFAPHVRTRV